MPRAVAHHTNRRTCRRCLRAVCDRAAMTLWREAFALAGRAATRWSKSMEYTIINMMQTSTGATEANVAVNAAAIETDARSAPSDTGTAGFGGMYVGRTDGSSLFISESPRGIVVTGSEPAETTLLESRPQRYVRVGDLDAGVGGSRVATLCIRASCP